jgi:hypothetical protein
LKHTYSSTDESSWSWPTESNICMGIFLKVFQNMLYIVYLVPDPRRVYVYNYKSLIARVNRTAETKRFQFNAQNDQSVLRIVSSTIS